MSMSFKRCSPEPSKTGRMARCSSSIRAARRYCRIVATPPPRRTSRPPAAAVACARAAPPDAERILEILARPGPVAVDGDRQAVDAEFRHDSHAVDDVEALAAGERLDRLDRGAQHVGARLAR